MSKFIFGTAILCTLIATGQAQVPKAGHVFIVVEENTNYSSVIGSSSMPYLNSLATQYGLATQYYANTHPSIGNYFMLTAGQIVTNNDGYVPPSGGLNVDNVVRHLLTAGKTWKAYEEDLPSVGYLTPDTGNYARKHCPLSYFSDVMGSSVQINNLVPFTQFAKDLANNQLPNYSFITPNLCNDAHDCSLTTADNWLKANITSLIASPVFQQDGVLVIVFDESGSDNTNGGGRIAWVVVSPIAKKGYQSTTLYQHQSTVRMMMEALGLTSFPGAAATAPQMGEFFGSSTPAVQVAIAPTSATVASGGTQPFTATVTGSTSTSVTWSATAGSISSSGLFTAPTVSANTTVTVKATSVADPTKYGTATVTVTPNSTVTPVVSLSPTSLTFPNQLVGTTSAVQFVTLANTGNATLNFSSNFTVSGDFSFAGLGTCGPPVAAGASCTISVKFTPTAVGPRTGTVTISDNAAGSPQRISLSGIGLTSVIVLSTTTSNNYYVSTTGNDSNDGTASDNAHAWRTITHAGSLAVAGDTVHVLPGTYNGNVNTVRSGTATSRITYLSDTKWEAKIVGSGSGVMWDNSASYIDVIGFDISGPGCVGLDFYGVNDRAISNNVHNGAPFSTCSGGGAGIDESGLYAGNEYLANFVHDVGISDSLCGASGHKGVHGLYKKNPGKVINNVLINNCAFGVHAWSDPHNMRSEEHTSE